MTSNRWNHQSEKTAKTMVWPNHSKNPSVADVDVFLDLRLTEVGVLQKTHSGKTTSADGSKTTGARTTKTGKTGKSRKTGKRTEPSKFWGWDEIDQFLEFRVWYKIDQLPENLRCGELRTSVTFHRHSSTSHSVPPRCEISITDFSLTR
jgi:hypothetical protein